MIHWSNPGTAHPSPGPGLGESPALEYPTRPRQPLTSHLLSSSPRVSSVSLCVLASAPLLPQPQVPGASPPLPPGQEVCGSVAGQFLPSSSGSTPCVRAASARAPCGCAPGETEGVRAGGGDVCEPVSAWLTKAPGCGERWEGRGGSVAPGDPGCGLQLALARGLKTPPPALWCLGPGVGLRPLGLERGCLILCEHLW